MSDQPEKPAAPAPAPKPAPKELPPPSFNNSMRFVTADLYPRLQQKFGEGILELVQQRADDFIRVAPNALAEVCFYLRDEDDLDFDMCHCISSLDDGDAGTLSCVYHLFSLSKKHWIVLSVTVPKDDPKIPTVSTVWGAANWHEREAYDLMGIQFTGHPDLRRILCAEEWQGHPLRKDYEMPEHEIVRSWGL